MSSKINFKKSGLKKLFYILIALGMVSIIVANIVLLWFAVRNNKYVTYELEQLAKEIDTEGEYIEDGYLVMEQYEIKSTKNISDAYINKDDSKLDDQEKELLKLASDVLDEIIKDDMSDYEKELAIYDWMFNNLKIDSTGTNIISNEEQFDQFTPYGVLKGKVAVCVGFATTFRMFAQMEGMECHVVHNDSHSWDLVKLDDGKWYHVDIWSDVSSRIEYVNLNCNDLIMMQSHEWDGSALPKADGEKYLYLTSQIKKVKNVEEALSLLIKSAECKTGATYIQLEKGASDTEIVYLNNICDALNSCISASGKNDFTNTSIVYCSYTWYPLNDEDQCLGFFVYSEDLGKDSDYDEEYMNSLLEKIYKEFGMDSQYSDPDIDVDNIDDIDISDIIDDN